MIRYAIPSAVLLLFLALSRAWAFLPARYLPGNRARHLRLRLHLRLHPGKGFATLAGLHLRWGRLAALRRSRRIRPSLPLWERALDPAAHSVFLGRAHLRPPAAGAAGRARPGAGPAAHLQDGVPRRRDPALPRPGDRHHHQGRRVRPHLGGRGPGAARSTCSTRSASAASVDVRVVAGRRLRGPGDRDPPRRRVRPLGVAEGRGGRHRSGQRRPATTSGLTSMRRRWPGRTCAPSPGGCPAPRRARPSRSWSPAGAEDWAQTLAELPARPSKTAATVRMVMSRALSFMADPALAAVGPARPRQRVRHRASSSPAAGPCT